MLYLGGKSRLSLRLVDKIQELTKPSLVWEPFCGGASVTYEFARRGVSVVASDVFPGLPQMHAAVCSGFRLPPHGATDDEYRACKSRTDPLARAVQFGLSFGGKFNSGMARPPDKYARQFNKNAEKLHAVGRLIAWHEASYDSLELSPGSVVYCDPPYAGTTGYATGDFDHDRFWAWCRFWAAQGVHVFVSEFSAPQDIPCVLEIPRTRAVSGSTGTCVDRLYYLTAR